MLKPPLKLEIELKEFPFCKSIAEEEVIEFLKEYLGDVGGLLLSRADRIWTRDNIALEDKSFSTLYISKYELEQATRELGLCPRAVRDLSPSQRLGLSAFGRPPEEY